MFVGLADLVLILVLLLAGCYDLLKALVADLFVVGKQVLDLLV